jgi:putative FmdB family regulatory protein
MPTYGYQCKSCGHQFEVFQKITDAAVSACEQCGAAVKKLLYPVGIQFRGSGFHVNDYAKSSAAKDGNAEPKTDTKTETKTETKPAATSAAATTT